MSGDHPGGVFFDPADPDIARHHPLVCPHCGKPIDAAAGLGGRPVAGDAAVCFGCTTPSVYTADGGRLGLRKPTPEEHADLDSDEDVAKVISQLRAFKSYHRTRPTR